MPAEEKKRFMAPSTPARSRNTIASGTRKAEIKRDNTRRIRRRKKGNKNAPQNDGVLLRTLPKIRSGLSPLRLGLASLSLLICGDVSEQQRNDIWIDARRRFIKSTHRHRVGGGHVADALSVQYLPGTNCFFIVCTVK